MPPEKRDAGYLWDMREAARDCIEFVKAATYDEFCTDRMMHSAVERRLEILGEAAGRVSEEFQKTHAEIPWKEIKAIRVILATAMATLICSSFGKLRKRICPICCQSLMP